MKRLMLRALLCALLPLLACTRAAAQELPGDSVYQLRAALTDQAGRASGLDVFRGGPVLVSMFYASCPNACPMLIASMRQLESRLEPAQRERLRVLLISVDPERDTPEKLAEVGERHRVDLQRWRLARASAEDVRGIAAVLGIAYRKTADGEFNHASIVSLLDGDGRVVAATAQPLRPEDRFMTQLQILTAGR